jgi:hypothetical protein
VKFNYKKEVVDDGLGVYQLIFVGKTHSFLIVHRSGVYGKDADADKAIANAYEVLKRRLGTEIPTLIPELGENLTQ